MSTDVVISRIRAPDGRTIRVYFHKFKRRHKFSIRYTYIDADGEEALGSKGITLSPQVLPIMARALADAEHHARESGLLE